MYRYGKKRKRRHFDLYIRKKSLQRDQEELFFIENEYKALANLGTGFIRRNTTRCRKGREYTVRQNFKGGK